ncbi:MAG TPA: AMP-binding protein, partial [Paracoccaceae bacterium]|nr:AMP-binding protein [Paracoccaceae bacterium]
MMDPAPRHLGWHSAARLITPTGTLDRSAAIARARQFAGAAVGADTVGISLSDPAEAICAAFGAMLAGKPSAILDPHWPKSLMDSVATSIEGFRIIEAPAPDAPFGPPSTISDHLICFTSGSTGLPKGVLRSHASWIESFRAISPFVTVTPEDTILSPGQLCHSTTLFAAMHGLYYGADVILLGAFSVAKALEATRKATILYATPAQLALMV